MLGRYLQMFKAEAAGLVESVAILETGIDLSRSAA
jgi:hypothetical protein